MKKYILLIISTAILFACDGEPTEKDLCKNKTCNEWEQCNKANGVCQAKEGYCSQNGDCLGLNSYCDAETHTCKQDELCKDVVCDEWKECKSGTCFLKAGSCEIDGDCSGENNICEQSTHLCKTKENICENITCGGEIAGECGVENGKAKCFCHTGYFNKTELECLEDNCINRSKIGHTQETATELSTYAKPRGTGLEGYELTLYSGTNYVCTETQNIYKFSDEYVVFVILGDYNIKLYKNSISEENIIKQTIMYNTVFYAVDNPEKATYYLVLERIYDTGDWDRIEYFLTCESALTHLIFDETYACDNSKLIQTCNTNSDCSETNYCNVTNHTCELKPCTNNNECNSGYKCIDNFCKYDLSCQNDGECETNYYCENNTCQRFDCIDWKCDYITSNRNYECFMNEINNSTTERYCHPVEEMQFGGTKELNIRTSADEFGIKTSYYYFRVNTTDNIIDFTSTLSNIENLNDIDIYMYSYLDEAFFRAYNLEQAVLLKKPLLRSEDNQFIDIKVVVNFKSCFGNCSSIKPKLTLSQNDSSGCSTNEDCTFIYPQYEGIAHSYFLPYCNPETNVCDSSHEIGTKQEGEYCDSSSNCVGRPVWCVFGKCSSTAAEICETSCGILNGEQLVCDTEERICYFGCESDYDCSIYKHCNTETKSCDWN